MSFFKGSAKTKPNLTSPPVQSQYPSDKLTISAGAAIFHLATARVVICFHTRDKYYFLPKGRKNANEVITVTAEREGFEESGYRNRVLPIPIKHRATQPDGEERIDYVTEPVWTQFLPLTATSQYLLFWYAAETVPEEVEEAYTVTQANTTDPKARLYRPPPAWPRELTVKERIAMDRVRAADGQGEEQVYEPIYHEGTGVDEEELLYRSELVPIEEAKKKLRSPLMQDLLDRIWAAIQLRMEMEEAKQRSAEG